MDVEYFMGFKSTIKDTHPDLDEFTKTHKPMEPQIKKNYGKVPNFNHRSTKRNKKQFQHRHQSHQSHQSHHRTNYNPSQNSNKSPLFCASQTTKSKIKKILNKLSKNNIDSIEKSLKELKMSDDDAKDFIDLIFEKACCEPKYSHLYAEICSSIKNEQMMSHLYVKYNFMVGECLKYEETVDLSTAGGSIVDSSAVFSDKKEAVSFVEFIGELYNSGLIELVELLSVINGFFSSDGIASPIKCQLRIDYICAILKRTNNKFRTESIDEVEGCIDAIKKLIECSENVDTCEGTKIDIREKFALVEIVELYQNPII